MTKSKHKNKKSGKQSKFVPAKTPEGRRRQHFAIKAKKKQAQTNGSQRSTSAKYTYGNPIYVDKYPHFRQYKKSGHPALIELLTKHNKTGEDVYGYRDVTHSKYRGRHMNQEIDPNPDRTDPKPMYIRKGRKFDSPENFSDLPLPWEYPELSDEDTTESSGK